MKYPQDIRHKKRQRLLEEIFKMDFLKQKSSPRAKQIFTKKEELDENILKSAPQFPIEKINKVDLAILRLAFYEILFDKKEPPKVIVDEAIELAKEYGGDTSPSFINGALGKVLDNLKIKN